jgi:hypothetical protein
VRDPVAGAGDRPLQRALEPARDRVHGLRVTGGERVFQLAAGRPGEALELVVVEQAH